jgi:hypothetical protein
MAEVVTVTIDPGEVGIPYGSIKDLLVKGSVVPFLGAGASAGTSPPLPLGGQLAADLARDSGLSELLARDVHLADYAKQWIQRDLPHVASYYSNVASDKDDLNQRLEAVFRIDPEPRAVHNYVAEIAKSHPLLVTTTNYDVLLERAFRQAGVSFFLIVHAVNRTDGNIIYVTAPGGNSTKEFDPKDLDIDLTKYSVIYKMHGSYTSDIAGANNYLVTEEQYIEFLAKIDLVIPAFLATAFRASKFLFLGYGLSDWNFRLMLHNIQQKVRSLAPGSGVRRHWAIQLHPSEMERKIWLARGVNVYDMDIEEFVKRLEAFQ